MSSRKSARPIYRRAEIGRKITHSGAVLAENKRKQKRQSYSKGACAVLDANANAIESAMPMIWRQAETVSRSASSFRRQ